MCMYIYNKFAINLPSTKLPNNCPCCYLIFAKYIHILEQKTSSNHSATTAATHPTNEEETPNDNSDWIWILSLVAVLVLCASIGIFIYYRRKSKLMLLYRRLWSTCIRTFCVIHFINGHNNVL